MVDAGGSRKEGPSNRVGGLGWTPPKPGRPSPAAVERAAGGLHVRDPRHFHATWLVSAGVPVNVVGAVMRHESTQAPSEHDGRVGGVSDGPR